MQVQCVTSARFLPEVVLRVVLSADWVMVLQLLKHYRAGACCGGAPLWLRRSKWTLTDLAARKKAHQPRAALFPNSHYIRQPVQIAHQNLTVVPGGRRYGKAVHVNPAKPKSFCYLAWLIMFRCWEIKMLTSSHRSQWTWREEGNLQVLPEECCWSRSLKTMTLSN